jgi:hypothetical protein
MNVYGDVMTDEMANAQGKIAALALYGNSKRHASRAKSFKLAEACASRTHRRRENPPAAGFEDHFECSDRL